MMTAGKLRNRLATLIAPPELPVFVEINGVQTPAENVRIETIQVDGKPVATRVVIVSETKQTEEAK
jgi:hypothetical protein